ncbi:hypothetical protein NMG60_11016085 [Bertholletia excelsa]
MVMETEDIVIVGAGIAGLTTSLGLHRLGLRSLVLESSESLRTTGYALTLWTNAFRALDAVGIGFLRQNFLPMTGIEFTSSASGPASEMLQEREGKEEHEMRCVWRSELLETLERQLPAGTVRYSSKVVSIEESGHQKLLHLADGSIIRTKVLIGCDGVNSVVAKWLGLQKPNSCGRSAIRGFVEYPDGHGFSPKIRFFFPGGVRFGFLPCDDKRLYWFCTFNLSAQPEKGMEEDPVKMKQFVLSRVGKVSKNAAEVVERTKLDTIFCSPLKLRLPWNLLTQNISKGNVCVIGDALHPMTPDIGQGGCSALEDSVVLARCLGEALLAKPKEDIISEEEEQGRINKGLEKFARERRWRSFSLVTAAFVVGYIQESHGRVMAFLREKLLSRFTADIVLKMADFKCGDLINA